MSLSVMQPEVNSQDAVVLTFHSPPYRVAVRDQSIGQEVAYQSGLPGLSIYMAKDRS